MITLEGTNGASGTTTLIMREELDTVTSNIRMNVQTRRTYNNEMVVYKKDIARQNYSLDLDIVGISIDGTYDCNPVTYVPDLITLFKSWIGETLEFNGEDVKISNEEIEFSESSPVSTAFNLELEVIV